MMMMDDSYVRKLDVLYHIKLISELKYDFNLKTETEFQYTGCNNVEKAKISENLERE